MLRRDREDPFFPSECSSVCESGWTMYLEHSFGEPSSLTPKDEAISCQNRNFVAVKTSSVQEEEDLSMVSDASSGPPHFHEDDDYCDENGSFSASLAALVKKSDKRRSTREEAIEEDTASSVFCNLSKKSSLANKQEPTEGVLDVSMGFSTTHSKGFRKTVGAGYVDILTKSLA